MHAGAGSRWSDPQPMTSAGSRKDKSSAPQLTRRRAAAFLVVAILAPFVLMALLEIALRAGQYGGSTALFEAPSMLKGRYLVRGQNIGRRYFPREQFPPSPPGDEFLVEKPANSLRLFVMGESSAAGFPYPANGTFSRMLRDALRDVLPGCTVEVVNLGMAATNSYTIVDLAREVVDQKPDAILIYGGHNEYYGALGAGSTESLGAFPSFVRLYLRLQRFKTFLLLRNSVNGILAGIGKRPSAAAMEADPSRMESVVRDQRIVFGGATYERGKRQYESNLRAAVGIFKESNVPVFIGSTPSNLRSLRPFGIAASREGAAAHFAFDSAEASLVVGDTTMAATQFARARDLDPVRFRAPGEFSVIVKRVASETASHYVPVEETFAAASEQGIPGSDLFLEHVHPNRRGYLLLAKVYFEGLAKIGFLGRKNDVSRLASWQTYSDGARLTQVDERIAYHTIKTITTRWPFVPVALQTDYRGTYRPVDLLDSIAFASSRGAIPWARAKAETARLDLQRGDISAAVAEYDGLIRDSPHIEVAYRLAGEALLSANLVARAKWYIENAYTIAPSAANSFSIGLLALKEKDAARAIPFLQQAVRLDPVHQPAMYQLSLAYAVARDIVRAREVADRLARINPRYPGLEAWIEALAAAPG